jgi:hypothetical protein
MVALAREAADYKDKLLRSLAEMENLRKRTERQVADAREYGIASFARDILAVADNMERGGGGGRSTRTCGRKPTPEQRPCSMASSSPSANFSRCWKSTA